MSAKDGQHIILAGLIGLEASRVLLETRQQELAERLPESYMFEAREVIQRSFARSEICQSEPAHPDDSTHLASHTLSTELDFIPLSAGGLHQALRQLVKTHNCGCQVMLRKAPILQETVELAEALDLDPYRLASDGCRLYVTAEPEALLQQLQLAGVPAAIIGFTIQEHGIKFEYQ